MLIGLAPLDGITDAAFRFIVDKYGHPDVIYTEFVPTEGIVLRKPGVLKSLIHHSSKTPLIVQLVGVNPDSFYQASKIIINEYPDFAGIDINMGCPDRSVVNRGAGAGLICKPKLALNIIKAVNLAVKDCSSKKMSVSVKTRIGLNGIDDDWIKILFTADLSTITFHLRTLEQIYSGPAHWEYMDKIVQMASQTNIRVFGNGNIKSKQQALKMIEKYHLAGVLIGRGALGNPWVFTDHIPTKEERVQVMLEHCQKFMEFYPGGDFKSLRKHLAWYAKDFIGSAKIRKELMAVNNLGDVKKII